MKMKMNITFGNIPFEASYRMHRLDPYHRFEIGQVHIVPMMYREQSL